MNYLSHLILLNSLETDVNYYCTWYILTKSFTATKSDNSSTSSASILIMLWGAPGLDLLMGSA